jgi:ATP-dependent helicase/nuclease subunit A
MTHRPAFAIDETTRTAVSNASDPRASAWVSANAGSGKTFVLARRVVRLLLAGTDPGRILCLTFTKAAAAEMAKRVFATLAHWTTLSDSALRKEIVDIGERAPDANGLAVARRLFARALETPGGLKIQTIHAFCERLLHQFPFEANVPGHFDVLEERDAAALTVDARRRVLVRAARDPQGPLGDALTTVLAHASDLSYEEALAEFVQRRDRLRALLTQSGGFDRTLLRLRAELGLAESDSAMSLRSSILAESVFDLEAMRRLVTLLDASDRSTDRRAAARLAPCLARLSEDARIEAWLDFLTKADGDLRKPGGLVTAGVKVCWPELGGLLEAEVDRVSRLLDCIKAAECFATTAAMVRLADAAIDEYGRLKAGREALDFEDLIVKTASLLARSEAARWVQYKLDRGIDHILVDEAQDTNPRQWQVILSLADDFFAGAGASEVTRTLFAVGDEKQSIFSFQGAIPDWFARVQRNVARRARGAAERFEDVRLHLSFRSTRVVLKAVDAVFGQAEARSGVCSEEDWPFHTAARHNDPGRVVVWPLIEPPEQAEPQDWTTPLDHLDARSPEVQLAERIAATIDAWLAIGETLEATGRPIRPGGILVLTRTRGAHTDAINRALKSRGVPIAGADRLRLTEHIAVMDLMALGRVMLLPEDDLSLAAVLRSPLIGLSEEALFALAHGRRGSLWDALEHNDDSASARARARLEAWRGEADWRDPHAFFARILGPEHGRLAFMRRLGAEADDVLDEFLAQALAYERTNTPSLQGFLAWLEAQSTEITRDTDMLRDEVRVMTVHGAKGLEADVVFLVDTGTAPVHSGHDPRVIALGEDADDPAAPLVWMRSRRAMPATVKLTLEALRRRDAEEYRRLLYVAMTRARDRLYVCGTKKQSTDADAGWHGLVTRALEPGSRRIESDGTLVALEWSADVIGVQKKQDKQYSMDLPTIPGWAERAAPPAAASGTQLAPSTVLRPSADAEIAAGAVFAGSSERLTDALARGHLIHRLLQSLPNQPAERRRAVGAAYLASIASTMDGDAILDEVLSVLDDPRWAPLFAPGSRAEVDIAGQVALRRGTASVSGRIDRLAVTATQVFVVDYKTNRPAPRQLADVPEDYVVQLALYRHILRTLYPDRPVTAALLWTDIPLLMEIPSRLLDQAASDMIAAKSAVPQDVSI